jgi:hypothetical protein
MGLETVVHHVCEKTSGLIVHIPDVDAVYQQILSANASKYPIVLLLPELNGHENWSEELAWIAANFGGSEGIPIMLDVFGGGSGESPTPMLSTSEISDARSAANVQWLRFAEVISWHLEHEQPFPTVYVADILSYCQTNNLKLYWCEWKIDYAIGTEWAVRTFDLIRELIEGYEDLVFVGFKTNSGDLEPHAGFSYVKAMFENWGGTVESWYWETRHRTVVWEPSSGLENPDNMPISWMVTHANQARSLGAQILQFEPYWYFFDRANGQAKTYLKTLHNYLNSNSVCMDVAAVILQTLKAEWLFGPEKEAVAWLWGRASTVAGWDIQPSTFDFSKITKRYAVSCYSLQGSSPSGKMWLKTEVVAVDLLVKVLGTTLEKACFARDLMQVEVERILAMYSRIAPLWDPNPGPTGAYKHRRIPGVSDVVVSQVVKAEDERYARVTLHVTCKLYPQKVWAGGT